MESLKHLGPIKGPQSKSAPLPILKGSILALLFCSNMGCKSGFLAMRSPSPAETTRSLASQCQWTIPQRIILIRHGEKIDDSNPGLSPEGCERAYQLPALFASMSDKIAGVFAQQPNKAGGSLRPLETIAPTASALHLKINNSFRRDEIEALAQEILTGQAYKGNTVIVAWEHSMIPQLAQKLGVNLTEKLTQWPAKVFDQAWIISYPNSGSSFPNLSIVAEHVLPTDITNDLSGVANWGVPETHQIDPSIQIPNSVLSECQSGNQSLDTLVQRGAINPVPGL